MRVDVRGRLVVKLSRQSGQKHGGGIWRRGLALAFAALALAACSTLSTGYNNAPTLLTWWADSYFDLDGGQEDLLKDRLRALRAWHRTQLPDYARAFGEVQLRLNRTVQPEDVAWLYAESTKRMRRLAEHAAPDAALIATRLRAGNLEALRRKLEKNNAEFEDDYVNAAAGKRADKRYERVLKEAERWYGSFDREQKKQIRVLTARLPTDLAPVLADRKRRQAELLGILEDASAQRAPTEEIARRLLRWTDYERGRTPEFQAYAQAYRREAERVFAAIANLATPEQRETAIKNVGDYMEQFNALAVAGN